MQKVFGRIVNRATGAGIRNIVVTAYDSSETFQVPQKERPGANLMRSLGRRLSSALTDDSGRFELSPGDLAFTGNEPRPDLVIVAFAPEDVGDRGLPYPAPPEERILYMSVVARSNAGAEEPFHIRLSPDQLASSGLERETSLLASAMEGAWRARDALTERLAERVASERKRSEERKARVKVLTKNLSAVPRAMRDSPLLAIGRAELEARRHELQNAAIAHGLRQIADSKRAPTLRLYLNEKELADLGVGEGSLARPTNLAVGGSVKATAPVQIDAEALFGKAAELTGASSVLRRRIPLPDLDALERRYLSSSKVPNSVAQPGRDVDSA